jgi:2-oxoglutarate ferredoxin oxidoreductase subunit beta
MSELGCSLLTLGSEEDREYGLQDYAGATPRWCPGCGDNGILAAVQRLLEAEQLPPERTVFVSGIGCSSRFPHYLKTYGFHGIHGRALPVATGVKLHRPDLHVFVVMGATLLIGRPLDPRARHNTTWVCCSTTRLWFTKKQTSPPPPGFLETPSRSSNFPA